MIKPIAKVTAQLGVQQMEGLTLFMDDYEQHAGETVLEKSARVGNAMQTKVLMSAGADVRRVVMVPQVDVYCISGCLRILTQTTLQ